MRAAEQLQYLYIITITDQSSFSVPNIDIEIRGRGDNQKVNPYFSCLKVNCYSATYHSWFNRMFHNAILRIYTRWIAIVIGVGNIVGS